MSKSAKSYNFGKTFMAPGLVFLVILCIFFYLSLNYLEQKHREYQLQTFSSKAQNSLRTIQKYFDDEAFWCIRLTNDLQNSSSARQFTERLNKLAALTGQKLPAVVWHNKQVYLNTWFSKEKNLKLLGKDLGKVWEKSAASIPEDRKARLRQMLGPHLVPSKIKFSSRIQTSNLNRTDFANIFPYFWYGKGKSFSSIVFFHEDWHVEQPGIKYLKNSKSFADLEFLFVERSQPAKDSHKIFLGDSWQKLQQEGLSSGYAGNYIISGQRVSATTDLIFYKRHTRLIQPQKIILPGLLFLIVLLLVLALQKNRRWQFKNLTIRWQLLSMLLLSTILPAFLLVLVADDHLGQKRESLIKQAHQSCIDFIQHIDKRSLVNQASTINTINKSLDRIDDSLPQIFPHQSIVKEFDNSLGKAFMDLRMISSAPPVLLTPFCYYKNDKITALPNHVVKEGFKVEAKVFTGIAYYILSLVNNKEISSTEFAEYELLTEMFYQKPFFEVVQNLVLASDKVFEVSLGHKPYPVYFKLLRLAGTDLVDYFFLIIFNDFFLQLGFLEKQFVNLQRNKLAIDFKYASKARVFPEKQNIDSNPWFSEIYYKTSVHPNSEPSFTVKDGKRYIYAGIKGQNLSEFHLFAFYPLEKINRKISEERNFLISSALMALLMLCGLALTLSSGFTSPLAALEQGAHAIRNRELDFRLPQLGRDEFNEMAQIFNAAIADFEELAIAAIVQKRLLPTTGLACGKVSVFGKTLSMAELGGDYYDYFKADESHCAMLIGDVAGHGVAASLIMAMAKAATTYHKTRLNDPALIVAKLHKLILETRSRKQKKIMTFQYLYIDTQSGQAIFSNAGGCSPLLIDSATKEVEEINLPAPVLGGFKNSSFTNLDLHIKPEQALIFYTDGIIETRNTDGEELGYERFRQIIVDCYNSEPQIYYENVNRKYREWLGLQRPQDDMTLVILAVN